MCGTERVQGKCPGSCVFFRELKLALEFCPERIELGPNELGGWVGWGGDLSWKSGSVELLLPGL